MKKDVNIQIIRIISMFFILLCHFSNEMQNKYGSMLGQFFNVGVFVFLFISGYLFGKKDIRNVKEWYKKRFIRIFIPLWIWTIVVNIIYLIKGQSISIMSIFSYIFNLQGFCDQSNGLEHLWFLSLIMVCYLITPLLNKIRNSNSNNLKASILLGGVILVSILISYIVDIKIGRYIFECGLYIFAYYYSFNEDRFNLSKIKYIYFILVFILCVSARIILKKYLDNTVFYTNFIVLLTQSLIAICMFGFVKKINLKIENKKIINIIDNLDKTSFYIYIVHYVFCVGPLDIVKSFGRSYFVQVFATLVLSYILAQILAKLTDYISRILMNERRVLK